VLILLIYGAEHGHEQALVTLRANCLDIDVAEICLDLNVAVVQLEFSDVLAGAEKQATSQLLV
jgi:hypothetical protein